MSLETLNYWNDARVQRSMVSSYYTIMRHSPDRCELRIDSDHLVEALYMEELDWSEEDSLEDNKKFFEDMYGVHFGTDAYFDEDDNLLIIVSSHYEVCSSCRGSGTMVNPSIDCGGLSDEDFYDEEFRHDYMSGRYDVKCSACEGQRLIPVPVLPPKLLALVEEWDRDQADYARMVAAERAYGC